MISTHHLHSENLLLDNEIGVEGLKAVAELLKTNATIETLFLGYNEINEEGADILKKALEQNKTLRYLILSSK